MTQLLGDAFDIAVSDMMRECMSLREEECRFWALAIGVEGLVQIQDRSLNVFMEWRLEWEGPDTRIVLSRVTLRERPDLVFQWEPWRADPVETCRRIAALRSDHGQP